MKPFAFNMTPSVRFGAGIVSGIGPLVAHILGSRILVVTDQGLLASAVLKPALASLAASGLETQIFADVVADPPEAVVLTASQAARDFGATGVLGIGGGSPLDVAKLAALLGRSNEPLAAAYGVGNARGPRLPLALCPTTAGTGSEVTPISIVTTGTDEKKGVVSPLLLPDIAILDPDLTLALPPRITAATGIDAMVHAIEAFTSISANNNPISRALANEALALLGRHLETAVHRGEDREARAGMLLGSMLAGQAFANSPVAAVHALAYPLGGIFHIPHGLSNALVLPAVLRFNASHAGAAYTELAAVLFPGTKEADLASGLAALSARIGLPQRLRDVNVPRDAIPRLAANAMRQTRLLQNNPRILTEPDAMSIYEASW